MKDMRTQNRVSVAAVTLNSFMSIMNESSPCLTDLACLLLVDDLPVTVKFSVKPARAKH